MAEKTAKIGPWQDDPVVDYLGWRVRLYPDGTAAAIVTASGWSIYEHGPKISSLDHGESTGREAELAADAALVRAGLLEATDG